MSFEIKLPLFEGPFDLLLFFIERDELDIYDIPISKITNDFLDYLKHLESLNIEVASEFILVASTLMRIKAKMLLPRPQIDEEGNEIDPREELVKHLLEYKKYKSVLNELSAMEGDMMQKEKRGNVNKEVKSLAETVNVEAELQNVDLYKLLNVFRNVMAKYELEQNKPKHRVVQYPYTIEGQKDYILDKVAFNSRLPFTDLIADRPNKVAVIFNFLAILELLQSSLISITVGEGFNNFWLEKVEQEAE
ncbi:segregation/condensation protein A [Marivirga atlantica]|uniref:Segregation and condensation protein A n=1 Tax=Marivirga atlantica TaxID=1548457 RepID=A0A937A688_9BACT|nr:segregation/condensation protein A [Marivirga atlantica]MBL0764437.1 segregation/condensation protein A [Marivirga atlantica]